MKTAVVTCLFNPTDSAVLGHNFKRTVANISSSGVPVYAVELLYPGQAVSVLSSAARSKLAKHILIRGFDILWQKEALLNEGMRQAKLDGFEAAAWVDGDVLYGGNDWYSQICEGLDHHDVLQCFKTATIVYGKKRLRCNSVIAVPPLLETNTISHTGLAWAARLTAIPQGLFLGIPTGDELMWAAFTHHIDDYSFKAYASRMNLDLQVSYAMWKLALKVGSVGFIDTEIAAQAHGSIEGRSYRQELYYYCRNFKSSFLKVRDSGDMLWSNTCPIEFSEHVSTYFDSRAD